MWAAVLRLLWARGAVAHPPERLYRYRPCSDEPLEREPDALVQSYLYAPSFASMNDPMEAFFEVGGDRDQRFTRLAPGADKTLANLYGQVTGIVEKAGLTAFSATHEDLPRWAYCASNFAGFCLEFDTAALPLGDLHGEELHAVPYAERALPAASIAAIFKHARDPGSVVNARLSRKRMEWAHEREWRYITGASGETIFCTRPCDAFFSVPECNQRTLPASAPCFRTGPWRCSRALCGGST